MPPPTYRLWGKLAFPSLPPRALLLQGRKRERVPQIGAAVAGSIARSGLPAASVPRSSSLAEVEARKKFSGRLSCSLA